MRSLFNSTLAVATAAAVWVPASHAATLTADAAVEMALKKSSAAIQAEASVLDARAGVYSAASRVLPRVGAEAVRAGSWTDNQPFEGATVVGGQFISGTGVNDIESYSTSVGLSGSWNVLDLSGLRSLSAARTGLKAAQLQRQASRQDVVYSTRRQFYEVVRAIHLSNVADGAVRLARDDERRVRALFEVGSVSKSDLLRAQVRTSQSALDSLVRRHAVTVQRNLLARQVGVAESEMGDLDTTLAVGTQSIDKSALLADAERNRPDLKAVDAELRSARAALTAARLARLPYVSVSASVGFDPKFDQKTTTSTTDTLGTPVEIVSSFSQESDRRWQAAVALNWDVFDGLGTDSRIASARARFLRAQDGSDQLRRNLEADVHEAWLAHREALEEEILARRSVESATESMNLTQQKYNVGSATILDLIDAQVSLLRAQSDLVSALARIRVAEALVERIRGTGR